MTGLATHHPNENAQALAAKEEYECNRQVIFWSTLISSSNVCG